MEHQNRISFFVTLICVYFLVDFVKASEVHSKADMINAAIQNRSILDQGGIGHDACAGPNWQNVTKQRNSVCPKLIVWVPKKPGFREFVKVNEELNVEGGFSIAIFCHALQFLTFSVEPIFIPFVNEKGETKGTYDDLLLNMKDKTCEAVAGDVTIRFNRTQYINFTIPYLSSEVYMLVHGAHEWNQTLLTFLKPFTWRLWITVIGACIFIGVAIAILEYRVGNPKFAIPFYQKLVMVIWFPISTFYFREGKILNRCSKVVLVMWLSMIFIVVQIFTATLSSWLTLDQLRPKLPSNYDHVGYQNGSFLKEFIKQENNGFGKPIPLKTVEDFKNALSNGSVNAVIDELPYIELFLAKYGSDYMKFGPINRESGIAFAFPRGSPLVDDFSRAVINITESKIMMELIEKYDLGFATADKSQPNQPHPQSLDVQSFIGLFIFMSSVTIAAIIWSEISLMYGNSKVAPLASTVNSMHLRHSTDSLANQL
ncbi:Extracellular solute-binding protein, family 3 [Cynara cardunculus var. scolymus]|uniref:Extracellular solute-binding protein, family 3 n=1 Tax=Cynara cardunculus var. scolymus TaxID=59895 RepID=A0A103Y2L8_CYNCS|nr:Extracellular solute-binding protein, family 3 [Cynara cardunculus var. scolymus]